MPLCDKRITVTRDEGGTFTGSRLTLDNSPEGVTLGFQARKHL